MNSYQGFVYSKQQEPTYLNMMSLEEQITFKLQAAWNSCPGLSQLEPLLNVTARAFRDLICPDQLES